MSKYYVFSDPKELLLQLYNFINSSCHRGSLDTHKSPESYFNSPQSRIFFEAVFLFQHGHVERRVYEESILGLINGWLD